MSHRWADIFGLGEPPQKFSGREGAKNAKQGGSHYIRILATEGGADFFHPLKKTPEMYKNTVLRAERAKNFAKSIDTLTNKMFGARSAPKIFHF